MNKLENLIDMARLNELLGKKEEEKKSNTVLWVLAVIGAVAAVAAACLVSSAVVDAFHSEFSLPGAAVPPAAYGLACGVGILFALLLTAVALGQPVGHMLRRDPQETLTKGDLS